MDSTTKQVIQARLNLSNIKHAQRQKEERLRELRLCASGKQPQLFLSDLFGVKVAVCPSRVSLNDFVGKLLYEEAVAKYSVHNFYFQGEILDKNRSFAEQSIPFGASIAFSIGRESFLNNATSEKNIHVPKTLSEIENQCIAARSRCQVLQLQIDRAESRIERTQKRKMN